MHHLAARLNKRREIAEKYNTLIADQFRPDAVRPLSIKPTVNSARGLYVIQIDFNKFGVSRSVAMNRLRERGIATQVHFPPLHLQPQLFESADIMNPKYPGCLKYYSQALTLPLYDTLTEEDLNRIIEELSAALEGKPVTATSDRQTDMTMQ
jgi:dTDP-4-amino-4,6-dideoxygalactose transaminase